MSIHLYTQKSSIIDKHNQEGEMASRKKRHCLL